MLLISNKTMKGFWVADGNRERLIKWMVALESKVSYSAVVDRVSVAIERYRASAKKDLKVSPSLAPPTNIWKIMKNKTKAPATFAGLTFIFIVLYDKAQSDGDERVIYQLEDGENGALAHMHVRLRKYLKESGIFAGELVPHEFSTSDNMEILAERLGLNGGVGAIWKTADNVRRIFQMQPFEVADRAIFDLSRQDCLGLQKAKIRRFEVFRNSKSPATASHMFCRFMSSSKDWTLPRFHLFFKGADDLQYETNGVIFASEDTIYLFGGLEITDIVKKKCGLAMGMIGIPSTEIKRRRFPGLQFGHDCGETFSSRLIFQETDIDDSRKVPVGYIDRKEVRKKVKFHDGDDHLANKVNVNRNDVFLKGRSTQISAERLRDEVGRLVNPNPEAPRLALNGEPFNPADDRHLPFDTALSMLRHLPN